MKLLTNYKIRLIGILVVTLLRFGFINSEVAAGLQPATWETIRYNIIMSVFLGVTIWESNRLMVHHFNRRHPLGKVSARRFGIEGLYIIGGNIVMYALTIALFFAIKLDDRPPYVFLLFGLFDRFLYGMLVSAFYELLLFVNAWRKAMHEAEGLKKLNLTIQLESLKNQVKPHFLFNSLNTLTGLVERDSAQAVKFIAGLSKVYRYLLQSNEKELIGLQQELEFTQAYFFLLQTRFGEGISMEVDINDSLKQHCLIPPLTLQMLLENAVKHNQVSARKPLQVRIWAEADQWLLMQNNVQPKRQAAPSSGMGLTNIATKYRLLNQPEMMIQHDDFFFTIKVPLIKATAV